MTAATRALFSTIILLGGLGAAIPAGAQYNFLFGGRGGTDVTPEDWTLFKEAMRDLLEQGDPGSRRDWNNPDTGMRGDMLVEASYEWKGLSCRRVSFSVTRAKEQVPYHMNFCKTEQGTWAIAP